MVTGYQRAKIVAMWIKAHKPMPLDEFAATIDLSTMEQPQPDIIKQVQTVFPGAKPIEVRS